MSLIDEIKTKVPKRFQAEPDFGALVDTVRLNDFTSKEELLDYFDKGIQEIEDWVKNNVSTGGTVVKDLRDKTIKLGTFKACKRYVEEYL